MPMTYMLWFIFGPLHICNRYKINKNILTAFVLIFIFFNRIKINFAALSENKKAPYGAVLYWFAEREGFEPPEACTSTVFKTAAIDHSAIFSIFNLNLVVWMHNNTQICLQKYNIFLNLKLIHEKNTIFNFLYKMTFLIILVT